ncbi:replication initiation factor domain-containing protein [Lactobacillus sp.]|uniref:replication initiation factor domain-containing protein n=1 Tax=Lactobacillus sp. TaxID=1591 RepID=UPI0019AC9AB9|nr:replication initiation factor domain-containing protein [Lactobacillus sp.]MBD5429852.1 replication initiation factor domain-containing protein [Lactobacillus sp.]
MAQYYVTVDQVSINFPIGKMGGLNTALEIEKELHLAEILGGSDKAKALNHYSEAIAYYDGKIKIMWNVKKPSQGLLLYFSATGYKALQSLGRLRDYDMSFVNLLKYMDDKKARFTRLDVAIDVLDGDLTVNKLHQQLQNKKVLILDSLERELSSQHQKFFGANKIITGITCGARSSDNFLRIYDKKIEQDRVNAPYYDLAQQCKSWVRIEGEFKHDAAHAILQDLSGKEEIEVNQKLIGYVVKRWILADAKHKAIPLWKKLTELANGSGTIPPLASKLTDRLVQELKWFLTGGAAGVFYRVAQLFGEVGKADFLLFMFEYVAKPNRDDHYSIPSNMAQDLALIQSQHPNIETINYYLEKAVKEIEDEKKANHTDQSND